MMKMMFEKGHLECFFEESELGSMISDLNKGISEIKYNHLNLPIEISWTGSSNKIRYVYNAAGQKVKKTVMDGTTTKIVDYLDGFQYAGEVLQFFPHPEGYVKASPTNLSLNSPPTGYIYNYVYNYTDHLGNVRLSYSKNPATNQLNILEENHYYPFGLKHEVYISGGKRDYRAIPDDNEPKLIGVTKTDYQYKYNGKEFQDELGLGLYDYGNRNYEPAIGRFFNIDRFAEKYNSNTPYHYTKNNPIYFVDFKGDSLIINSASSKVQKSFERMVNNGLGGFYTVNINSEGKTTLSSTGKTGDMSKQQKAFFDTFQEIISNNEFTNISLVGNDSSVEIGSYSTGEIDVADVFRLGDSDLSSSEYVSAQGAIAHELYEQFDKQVLKQTEQMESHKRGIEVENKVNGSNRVENEAMEFMSTKGEIGTILRSTTTIGTVSKTVDIYIYNGDVVDNPKQY
ncbi:RHS repeat domain-containing protein [Moheibacter stercoris]|uniref:RHS repeat-associated protein n=1 Tax=Moheibacter stercoris TaxID=1628251 RepID=A0ABV2LSZ6_9FLAO